MSFYLRTNNRCSLDYIKDASKATACKKVRPEGKFTCLPPPEKCPFILEHMLTNTESKRKAK